MDTIRYWLFGKAIQKAMEMAETAGRDAERYAFDAELKKVCDRHEIEIDILVNQKLAALDHSVNPDDILTASYLPDGKTRLIYLNKEQLNSQEIRNLKQEVSLMKAGRLWKIINSTLKKQAEDIMFTKAATYDDMKAGKSMLRTLDIQQNIMDTIENFG